MNKLIKSTIFSLLLLMAATGVVNAGPDLVDVGFDNTGLDSISLPTFLSLDAISNFSIFSYISIILTIFFFGLVIVWVVMAIRAAYQRMTSNGDSGAIGESSKKFGRIFGSISMLFIFFIAIFFAAGFAGFGNFTEWPRSFSRCKDGRYYFTVALEFPEASDAEIGNLCFNRKGPSICQEVLDSCKNGGCTEGLACNQICLYQYQQCIGGLD